MAINDFNLGLIGKLDGTKSKHQLNNDIEALKKQLNNVEIIAKLDPKILGSIQIQLQNLQVQLKDVTVSQSALNGLVSQINSVLQHEIKISGINLGGQTVNQAKQTGQQIGKLISDSAEQAISRVSSPTIGRYFKIDSSTSNQFRTEMEKLVSEWTNAKGKLTDINIQTRTSYDKDADENITRLHQATVTYKNELDEVIKKTIAWRQIGTTTNAKGEEQVLRGFVEVAGQYSKSIDTITAKTDTFADKQKKAVGSLTSALASIKSGYDDKNASKPIKLQSNIDKLEEQYAKVETAIKAVGQANKSTFTDAEVEANRLISELRDMVKEYRNAENVSTKMKGTDFTSGLSIAKNDLEKFKSDAKDFPQIIQTIKDLDTAITNIGDASSLNQFNDSLRVARSELAKIKSETSATNRNEKVGINISGLQSQIADLQRISPIINNFETEINGAKVTVQSLLADLNSVNTQSDFSVVNTKWRAFTDAAKSAGIAVSEAVTKSKFADDLRVNDTITKLNEQLRKNSAYSSLAKDKITDWINELSTRGEIPEQRLREINSEARRLHSEMAMLGKIGKSTFQTFKEGTKSFIEWGVSSGAVMEVVQAVRHTIDNVRELDDQLLELSKVSNLSAEGLEKTANEAYKLGETVGKTGTQVLEAITTFKRAGFELSDSSALAEIALKMVNVAEGINDASEASQYLISIMKGYNDTSTEFATKILDSVNEVSNTQSVDFDNLVDGGQRLSAVANQAGVSFDQMLGVLTGGYEVLGNMEKTASGLITIFTRLQSIQLADEEEVQSVAKLQETFSKATNGRVNIVDQSTGQLRGAYDILNDLNNVWNELDKNTQEGLAFAAGGTRQKSVFLSIMSNWNSVEKSVVSATESFGSAEKENSKYLESLSGKIIIFDSAVEKLSNTVLNSGLLGFFVDLGTFGINSVDGLINSFGGLVSILGAGTGIALNKILGYLHRYTYQKSKRFCEAQLHIS